MEQDIGKTLAFKIKRELAERYFGTRRFIEDELSELMDMLSLLKQTYLQKIGRDLVRIYALLRKRELIEDFMKQIRWHGLPFYDEYVIESASIRKRLMEPILVTGWFSKTKFTNMLIDSYERLFHDCSIYMDKYNEAEDEYAIIMEEIKQFRNRYSLDEIMGFINQIDGTVEDASSIMGVVDAGGAQRLESKMELSIPDHLMSDIEKLPSIPSPDNIRKFLRELASKAAPAHRKDALASASGVNSITS